VAASDPTMAFRLILFTIGAIASAKTINITLRRLKQYIIHRHYRKCQPLLTKLYDGINAFEISLEHRETENIKSDEYIYGEIIYSTFADLLSASQPKPNEIFYDLGCGSGKAVFTTALLYPDVIARGVELLPPLYNLCLELTKKLKGLMSNDKYFKTHTLNIEFFQENLLEYDFSNANILFLNATCFTKDNWTKICEKMEKLAPGSRVIISSRSLESDNFELIHARSHLMSWGMNTVHIYRKIR